MEHPTRNPALDRLDGLVGQWTMDAGPPGGPPWPGEARVKTITGRWEKAENASSWETDFDLTYRKVG